MDLPEGLKRVLVNDLTLNSRLTRGVYMEYITPEYENLSKEEITKRILYTDPEKVIGKALELIYTPGGNTYVYSLGSVLPDNWTYEVVPRFLGKDKNTDPIIVGLDFNLIEVNECEHLYERFETPKHFKMV